MLNFLKTAFKTDKVYIYKHKGIKHITIISNRFTGMTCEKRYLWVKKLLRLHFPEYYIAIEGLYTSEELYGLDS